MTITLRDVSPNDATALAHILITANEATFRGLVPDACLEFTETESAANWEKGFERGFLSDRDVFMVAETSDNIVIGYAWGRPNNRYSQYTGELYQIHVLPDFQGQGIGKQLMRSVASRLTKYGIQSLSVEVMQVNPNRRFYEHLGAHLILQHIHDWDGIPMVACVYGWSEIANLLT